MLTQQLLTCLRAVADLVAMLAHPPGAPVHGAPSATTRMPTGYALPDNVLCWRFAQGDPADDDDNHDGVGGEGRETLEAAIAKHPREGEFDANVKRLCVCLLLGRPRVRAVDACLRRAWKRPLVVCRGGALPTGWLVYVPLLPYMAAVPMIYIEV